jgi:hypothetical protein
MLLITLIVAIIISYIFERQEQRHRFYESLEYLRIGKDAPVPEPKLPLLNSWMGLILGLFVTVLGFFMILSLLEVIRHNPNIVKQFIDERQILETSTFFAVGISVTIQSVKSIHQHSKMAK